MTGVDSIVNTSDEGWIREVWASNLEEEISSLRELVENYPFLSMDTEFPGVVARPIYNMRAATDYHYQSVRCNVDLLKLIQVGITVCDAEGNFPAGVCTWQFNFHFNLNEDMYAQDSIDLLQKSGIDFKKHEEYGIDVGLFAELLTTSGMVLTDEVKWITFHSGYDFGYLLKVLTFLPLPSDEESFFELLHIYFPCLYDIKYLMKSCKSLKGGLQVVADDLQIQRLGPQHQAGSDSLLTCQCFLKMRHLYFDSIIDDDKYNGYLYGLSYTNSKLNGLGSNPVSPQKLAPGMLTNNASQSSLFSSNSTRSLVADSSKISHTESLSDEEHLMNATAYSANKALSSVSPNATAAAALSVFREGFSGPNETK